MKTFMLQSAPVSPTLTVPTCISLKCLIVLDAIVTRLSITDTHRELRENLTGVGVLSRRGTWTMHPAYVCGVFYVGKSWKGSKLLILSPRMFSLKRN